MPPPALTRMVYPLANALMYSSEKLATPCTAVTLSTPRRTVSELLVTEGTDCTEACTACSGQWAVDRHAGRRVEACAHR